MKTALFSTVANCTATFNHIYIHMCILLNNSFSQKLKKNPSIKVNIFHN